MTAFTLATFNICSAHFRDGHYTDENLEAVAAVIRQSQADVVALQEVDRGAARSKQVDMPTRLSEMTELPYHTFIKIRDFQGGEYGTAIISRYPITKTETIRYPVTIATQGTSCGYAMLDVDGVPVTVWNTHLSCESEAANTETLLCLGDVLKEKETVSAGAYVLCGDFNTSAQKVACFLPWLKTANTDALATFEDRTIDHILYTPPITTAHTRILDTVSDRTTDHYMLVTDVSV